MLSEYCMLISQYHNGMRDLLCGASYNLIWSGSEYEFSK